MKKEYLALIVIIALVVVGSIYILISPNGSNITNLVDY